MANIDQPIWEKVQHKFGGEEYERLIPSLTADQLLTLIEDSTSTKLCWHVISHENANLEIALVVLSKYPTLADKAINNPAITDKDIEYLFRNNHIPTPDLPQLFNSHRVTVVENILDELLAMDNIFVDFGLMPYLHDDKEKQNIIRERNGRLFG